MSDRTPIRRGSRRGAVLSLTGLVTAALLTSTLLPALAEADASSAPKGKRKNAMTQASATPEASSPVFEATLENGLDVLIQEVHTAPVVSFMVWYRVGSRNETAGVTGVSPAAV